MLLLEVLVVTWIVLGVARILYASFPPQRKQRKRIPRKYLKKYWNLQSLFDRYRVPDEILEASGRLPNLGVMQECAILSIIFTDWDEISHKVTEQGNVNWLNTQLAVIDGILAEHKGIITLRALEIMITVFNEGSDEEKIDNAFHSIEKIKEAQKRAEQPLELQLAFGFHAGACILGAMSESVEAQGEFFTAIGQNVSISARLASLASKTASGETIISEDVYAFMDKEKFPCKELVPISIKSKEKPISIYSLSV